MTVIQYQWDGALTPTSVTFSDPDAGYGVRRTDTFATVVAAGTPLTGAGGNLYTYTFADPADGLTYEYYIQIVAGGDTYLVHGFIGGSGSAKVFSFSVVKDGALYTLAEIPTLENPAGTYGVIELTTSEVLVSAGEEFSEGGPQWQYVLGRTDEQADEQYRFYVRVVIDGTIWYLARTSIYTTSVALAVGRYTVSAAVEQQYGIENVQKWLGIDEHEDAADYALRAYRFIADAETEIDDLLRGGPCDIPFVAGAVPVIIATIATALAGVKMYESRGVVDMNPDTGQVQHRLQFQQKWVEKQIGRIKSGQLRLSTETITRHPTVVTE